jgi:LPS-assembly lipoprotein
LSYRNFKSLTILLALLATTACGFRPLYGEAAGGGSATAEMASIEVRPIADRMGQRLRNFLLDRLTPRGRPQRPLYLLSVQVSENVSRLAVRKDETATRANLRLQARYELTETRSGKVVLLGDRRSTSSFNILRSEFGTLSSEKDARIRSARDLADAIKVDLAVFFERQRAGLVPSDTVPGPAKK